MKMWNSLQTTVHHEMYCTFWCCLLFFLGNPYTLSNFFIYLSYIIIFFLLLAVTVIDCNNNPLFFTSIIVITIIEISLERRVFHANNLCTRCSVLPAMSKMMDLGKTVMTAANALLAKSMFSRTCKSRVLSMQNQRASYCNIFKLLCEIEQDLAGCKILTKLL